MGRVKITTQVVNRNQFQAELGGYPVRFSAESIECDDVTDADLQRVIDAHVPDPDFGKDPNEKRARELSKKKARTPIEDKELLDILVTRVFGA